MLAAFAFVRATGCGGSWPEQAATCCAKKSFPVGFKDVEGRAGPRIDFQQPEAFAFDEEVGAVQADKRRRGDDLLNGCGEFVRCSWCKRRRSNRTAIPIGLTRSGGCPLCAKSKNASAFSISKEARRDWRTGHSSLIVDGAARVREIVRRLDMRAAGASLALSEPSVSARRFRQRYLRKSEYQNPNRSKKRFLDF